MPHSRKLAHTYVVLQCSIFLAFFFIHLFCECIVCDRFLYDCEAYVSFGHLPNLCDWVCHLWTQLYGVNSSCIINNNRLVYCVCCWVQRLIQFKCDWHNLTHWHLYSHAYIACCFVFVEKLSILPLSSLRCNKCTAMTMVKCQNIQIDAHIHVVHNLILFCFASKWLLFTLFLTFVLQSIRSDHLSFTTT